MDKTPDRAAHQHLTLLGLLRQVREWPRVYLLATLLTVTAVVAYAFLATPAYRGTVTMMPPEADAGGAALHSILGQFGDLATMAGIQLGSVDEQEAIAWLKSRALFTAFAQEQNLMPTLFKDQWDAAAGHWRAGTRHTPTMDDAWAMFNRDIRRVSNDPKTRVITLDITWKDRYQAASWANELVRLANEELRQRALRESHDTIASLRDQLSHTEEVELRQSIFRLMEVQLNRSVLATSRSEYALTVLDPAVVPDARRFVAPRRFLMLVIALPLGLFMGACSVLAAQTVSELPGRMRPNNPPTR